MKEVHTAPISSLRTPMRLSRAARTPFWILIFLRAIKLFKGHPASKTIKPANALRPSNLHGTDKTFLKKVGTMFRLTGITIHRRLGFRKELQREYGYHVDEFGEIEIYIRTSIKQIERRCRSRDLKREIRIKNEKSK